MSSGWNYSRALEELWDRSSYERGLISDPFGGDERAKRGLCRMRSLLAELNNPQTRVRTVHVAGSKGKGSTAGFIAEAAVCAGLRVGLYTSPHLHRFPERIAINGHAIADEAFASVAEDVARAARAVEAASPELGTVTTFEFVTVMAFLAFAREAVDLAVIEVGLGGLYDATNVLEPEVTVITRIDFEHTAVLGSTLEAIAAQKAGIVRPGVPCVSSPQEPAAAATLEASAAGMHAPFLIGGRDWTWRGPSRSFTATGPWGTWDDLSLGAPGPHQVENACTALAALHVVNQAGITIPEAAIRLGFGSARWPGRFERHDVAGRTMVFDGAHTPAAAAALVETWNAEIGPRLATVVIGMGADKDIHSFLRELRPVIARLIVTRANSPRAADPAAIGAAALALGIAADFEPSVAMGLAKASETGDAPILLTGSLFVAGEGREALGLSAPDEEWLRLNEARLPRTNAP